MSCSGWKNCTLGELVKFQRGHDLSKKNMIEGIYPVAGSNGIIGYHNEYTTEAPCITIGRSGNVGTPFYYNKRCWAHNTTLYIKEFYDVDPKFIYYYLKTLNLGYYAGGSAVPTLNRNHINPISVCVPSNIEEQKKISEVLTTLDNKIELNNEINKTLEEMAQALFKRWFVDFEFPNEEGKPYKSSGGEMVESELGMIPKGWSVKKIKEIGEVVAGGTPSTKNAEYYDGNIPWITPKDLSGYDRKFISKGARSITELGMQKSSAKLMKKGTVLFSSRAPIGYIAIADNDVTTNQGFKSIVCDEHIINNNYVYHYLHYNKESIESVASGSTFKEVSGTTMKMLDILVPQIELLTKFKEVLEAYDSRLKSNYKENDSLIELRDSLLPKLMSGEIRVDDIKVNL